MPVQSRYFPKVRQPCFPLILKNRGMYINYFHKIILIIHLLRSMETIPNIDNTDNNDSYDKTLSCVKSLALRAGDL